LTIDRLFRGADAQFLLSLPHGAFHFFVIDVVKQSLSNFMPKKLDIFTDFVSSMVSTIVSSLSISKRYAPSLSLILILQACSVVSTPQMVLTDRLMAGVYPSLEVAVREIMTEQGFLGFYSGWWPALAQKIPSYG
jgi:hypothetical protein